MLDLLTFLCFRSEGSFLKDKKEAADGDDLARSNFESRDFKDVVDVGVNTGVVESVNAGIFGISKAKTFSLSSSSSCAVDEKSSLSSRDKVKLGFAVFLRIFMLKLVSESSRVRDLLLLRGVLLAGVPKLLVSTTDIRVTLLLIVETVEDMDVCLEFGSMVDLEDVDRVENALAILLKGPPPLFELAVVTEVDEPTETGRGRVMSLSTCVVSVSHLEDSSKSRTPSPTRDGAAVVVVVELVPCPFVVGSSSF